MTFIFHEEAILEAEKSAKHYFDIYPELGESFRTEVEEAIGRILNAPTAWSPI